MPSIVNPMDAFVTFGPALASGMIAVEPGAVDPNVYVHMDSPNGEPRWTFARIEKGKVTAIAIILMAEPYKGERCVQIGYAVAENRRGKGRAKAIAAAALAEFCHGVKQHGVSSFYVEAVVGVDNLASQRVAEAILQGAEVREINDEDSGEPAIQYMVRMET
jgi:predicted acetyltransferase